MPTVVDKEKIFIESWINLLSKTRPDGREYKHKHKRGSHISLSFAPVGAKNNIFQIAQFLDFFSSFIIHLLFALCVLCMRVDLALACICIFWQTASTRDTLSSQIDRVHLTPCQDISHSLIYHVFRLKLMRDETIIRHQSFVILFQVLRTNLKLCRWLSIVKKYLWQWFTKLSKWNPNCKSNHLRLILAMLSIILCFRLLVKNFYLRSL